MKTLPETSAERRRALLLPIYVYILVTFTGLKFLTFVGQHRRKYGLPYEAYGIPIYWILFGYLVCAVVLTSYGFYCVRQRGGDGAATAFVFAALALLFAFELARPLAAT
jgi:hypothetical protein